MEDGIIPIRPQYEISSVVRCLRFEIESGIFQDKLALGKAKLCKALLLGKSDRFPESIRFWDRSRRVRFSGQILAGISRLTDLISLDLSSSSSCVIHYSTVDGLSEYYDSVNYVQLRHPSFRTLVGNLSSLRELRLNSVDMSSNLDWGSALSTSMPRLRELTLSYCNLPGLLPTDILTSHTNLTLLDLSQNPMLSGNLPDFPSNNALQSLAFPGASLSGNIPYSISNLKHLTTLDISYCGLTGMMPSSIGNLTQLAYLDLSGHEFAGAVPSWIGNLFWLSVLALYGNNFTGPIPTSIGNLTHLTSLYLGYNFLSESVPVSLFNHLALESLDLSENQFSGELKEFSNPSMSLSQLDLSNNQLQGQIPTSLFKLSDLQYLFLTSNNFNGTVELDMIINPDE
ncbi:probable leucine-rich repeat receptor-like protein kinase At1g35710 [Asparagus officinalis]|uniref:probable leucine-rich repeat receptor-like protein kinase At1g35710 n=1 Tax=Asparagus officinalis TaxID=4686 RepID=UPI00098E03EC|nr:probable leucine-rich repeat receptor-like protein kinase At1g35710 [Asparagus officinalis]